jgi:hypothetical protein
LIFFKPGQIDIPFSRFIYAVRRTRSLRLFALFATGAKLSASGRNVSSSILLNIPFFDAGSSAAGFQSLHDVVNRYVFQHSLNRRIDFRQHVAQNSFDIHAHRTVSTGRLPVQRKDASALECLINVQQGRFCGSFASRDRRANRFETQPTRFGQFLQHAPDHDWIGVYALCNLFGFKGFFA